MRSQAIPGIGVIYASHDPVLVEGRAGTPTARPGAVCIMAWGGGILAFKAVYFERNRALVEKLLTKRVIDRAIERQYA